MGGNELSSKPPSGPVITELDPNNLPEDFPFDLAELGLAEGGGPNEPRELTMTERLIGMDEPRATSRRSIGPDERASTRARRELAEERGRRAAGKAVSREMRARGVEPPRAEAHRDLNPARLPIPPRPRP